MRLDGGLSLNPPRLVNDNVFWRSVKNDYCQRSSDDQDDIDGVIFSGGLRLSEGQGHQLHRWGNSESTTPLKMKMVLKYNFLTFVSKIGPLLT